MQKILRLGAGTILAIVILATSACHSTQFTNPSSSTIITIEAESNFTNVGTHRFEVEEESFYSGGAAIRLQGSTPIGASGTVRYALGSVIEPGQYELSVHYNDENDGHSPVSITIGGQAYTFVMNADTESGFQSEANQRNIMFTPVNIGKDATMDIQGEVTQYNSSHKELIRLDKFVFKKI